MLFISLYGQNQSISLNYFPRQISQSVLVFYGEARIFKVNSDNYHNNLEFQAIQFVQNYRSSTIFQSHCLIFNFGIIVYSFRRMSQHKNCYLVRRWWTQLIRGRRIPCAIATSEQRYVISCRTFQAVPHFLSSSQADKGTARHLPPRGHIYYSV